MLYQHVYLQAFGYELPPRRVTSAELEERLDGIYQRLKLPKGRLEMMTGIRERRLWESGTRPSEAAALAGRKAMAASGVDAREIDCLIFCSVSRDMMEPATASFVHNLLGLPERCLVFDLSNACLGFLNGMVMLANMIELGQIRTGLVVAGETAENLLESTLTSLLADPGLTRKTFKPSFASLTIGSGAVALVMAGGEGSGSKHRLVGGMPRANTTHSNLCQGGRQAEAGTLMATDSEELLQRGVETASLAWRDFLVELDWQSESIARFFCHQVGSAHSRLLFNTLGLDPEKNVETLAILGNVGSVSAPITLAMGVEQKLLAPGDRAAVLGIGSGINCLMLGILW